MKTRNWSLATVVLGALAASFSACMAEGQDNTVPGGPTPGHAGNDTNPGSAGMVGSVAGTTASGGKPNTGAAGSPASGGKPGGAAGSFGSGGKPGGAAGAATGAAGAATGAAGGGTVGGCKTAAGTIADLLIDDLEDGDNTIKAIGTRVGYWYTYNDGTGTQVPAPTAVFKGTAPGSTTSSAFAATTSGPAFTSYGAGMGFDFNNTTMKSCPYNASAYTGIKFYAKANTGNMTGMTLKAMIKIPATTPTTSDGGTCATKCEDHFYLKPAPALTTTWTQYTMPFASIAQDGFGTVATFDKTKILAMQFQVASGVAFNFSIDDITFY